MKFLNLLVLGLVALYGLASYIVYGLEQAFSGMFVLGLIAAMTWGAWKITHKQKTDKVKL